MTLGRCSCGAGSPRWMLHNSAMNSRHSFRPVAIVADDLRSEKLGVKAG